MGKADDHVQRGADFVGHVREEHGFRLVRLLGSILGLGERVGRGFAVRGVGEDGDELARRRLIGSNVVPTPQCGGEILEVRRLTGQRDPPVFLDPLALDSGQHLEEPLADEIRALESGQAFERGIDIRNR